MILALVNFGAVYGSFAYPHADIPHSNFDGHHGPAPDDDRQAPCDHGDEQDSGPCTASPSVSACFAAFDAPADPPVPTIRALRHRVGQAHATGLGGLPDPRPPRPAS